MITLVLSLVWAACSFNTPSKPNCDFYRSCLEEKIPCGSEGYALTYGEKYCKRFLSLNTASAYNDLKLSNLGVQWRDRTLICLQSSLAQYVLDESPKSCEDVTEKAFDSHSTCYAAASPSICKLPRNDWLSILRLVDASDYLSIRSVKQIKETIVACSGQLIDELSILEDQMQERFIPATFSGSNPNIDALKQKQYNETLKKLEYIKYLEYHNDYI